MLWRIPLCAADRSIPAVESIAGDEAAAAELDRLARLMEQQAILEKVPVRYQYSSQGGTFIMRSLDMGEKLRVVPLKKIILSIYY